MTEWELIQDRTLSGKGVLQVPTDVRKGRVYMLLSDVTRDPSSRYLNLTWNPPKGRYGNLVFLRNEYVISTATIDFERQCYDGISDITGQNLLAIKCAYSGILQSIANLGTALNATPVSIVNSIKDYESLSLSWDEVRLVCNADTALQLRLYRISYDVCEENDINTLSAPVPDAPIPKVPAGTPIADLSPPYDENTSDNGNSVPYPGDTVPPKLKPCWHVVGQGATPDNSPGIDLVPNGTFYPSWIRANTLTVARRLITTGYYSGCYGRSLVVDGAMEDGAGSSITVSLDPDNPSCPPK